MSDCIKYIRLSGVGGGGGFGGQDGCERRIEAIVKIQKKMGGGGIRGSAFGGGGGGQDGCERRIEVFVKIKKKKFFFFWGGGGVSQGRGGFRLGGGSGWL